MKWIESASAADSHADLERRLWGAANKLWADAALKPSEFSPIVLGLIFLRYAEAQELAEWIAANEAENQRSWASCCRAHFGKCKPASLW